jgi:hypothetical protein
MTESNLPLPSLVKEVVLNVPDPEIPDDQAFGLSRVGSIRPTAMLYTSGIGATVDLPHLSVIVRGLDAWEKMYNKLGLTETIFEPRLLEAVQTQLGPTVVEFRKPPWLQEDVDKKLAQTIGVPVNVFPRWLRCTGCDLLARTDWNIFKYENKNRFRPDQAQYFHEDCRGKGKGLLEKRRRSVVPARFLLACIDGHLDEFPFVEWVHRASGTNWQCKEDVPRPQLEMTENPSNSGPIVRIKCKACGASRGMQEATGQQGSEKLPFCRGWHPHLGNFFEKCEEKTSLMLLGAANQWFPATISLLVLPTMEKKNELEVFKLVKAIPKAQLDLVINQEALPIFRILLNQQGIDLTGINDDSLWNAINEVKKGTLETDFNVQEFDPISILEPEWTVMSTPDLFPGISERSVFKLTSKGVTPILKNSIQNVVAVERLKKVNAFLGFTRVDPEDRIGDQRERLVKIAKTDKITWVPASEDRGEGIFIEFNENKISEWEDKVLTSSRWESLRAAHERNFKRRQSRSAVVRDPDTRLNPPRYWAIHSLSHLLIRELSMHAGYGAASLTERIYAWRANEERGAAAGLLISTTSADSEGTLGGLVELSNLPIITQLIQSAIKRANHCSSDPLCSSRLPISPEDYLHGSACHFCLFVSETSCEKSNRFLDRGLVLNVRNSDVEGFFNNLIGK